MKLVFQIAFSILVGVGTIYAGVSNFISPAYVLDTFHGVTVAEFGSDAELAVSSQIRLLAGLWVAAGIFAIASVRDFERHGGVIRLILAGLSLGAVGEFVSAFTMGAELLPAGVKAGVQVALYLGLELWRMALVRKSHSANMPNNALAGDAQNAVGGLSSDGTRS